MLSPQHCSPSLFHCGDSQMGGALGPVGRHPITPFSLVLLHAQRETPSSRPLPKPESPLCLDEEEEEAAVVTASSTPSGWVEVQPHLEIHSTPVPRQAGISGFLASAQLQLGRLLGLCLLTLLWCPWPLVSQSYRTAPSWY